VSNGRANSIAKKCTLSAGLAIISRYFMNINDDDEFGSCQLGKS